jgi:hypothetical protein
VKQHEIPLESQNLHRVTNSQNADSIEVGLITAHVTMSLPKNITLSIDQDSWANAPASYRHPIPQQFLSPPLTTTFDFLRALTWVGMMAVPPNITGWLLAIRWAELRYLGAANHQFTELRLDPAVSDLETHYLASLSDD